MRRVLQGVAWLEQMAHFGEDGERPDQIKEGTESRQRILKRTLMAMWQYHGECRERLGFTGGWHCMLVPLGARRAMPMSKYCFRESCWEGRGGLQRPRREWRHDYEQGKKKN